MNQEELLQSLAAGQSIGIVLYEVNFTAEIRFKRVLTLSKPLLQPMDKYPWHNLQENPSYVREQKIIRDKPFLVTLQGVAKIPEAIDEVGVYFADLDEVDVFLQQFL